jgi:hypothetical protein
MATDYHAPRNLDKNLLAEKRKKTHTEPETEVIYSRLQGTGSKGDIERRENSEPIIGRIWDSFEPVVEVEECDQLVADFSCVSLSDTRGDLQHP